MRCLSRLTFHTIPGKTGELEKELKKLGEMVTGVGGVKPRVLHTHFGSQGAPDVVFEQEASDLNSLETQIKKLKSRRVDRTKHAEGTKSLGFAFPDTNTM